jgi:hypothetical protein
MMPATMIYSVFLTILTIAAGWTIYRTSSAVKKIFLSYILFIAVLIPVIFKSTSVFLLFLIPVLLTASAYLFEKNMKPIHTLNMKAGIPFFVIYCVTGLIFGSLVFFTKSYSTPGELVMILSLLLAVLFVLIIRQSLEKEGESKE